MHPFFKTWLTICLFIPLAAHATSREQTLPASFSGYTAKGHHTPAVAATTAAIETQQAPANPSSGKSSKNRQAKSTSHRVSANTVALSNTPALPGKQSNAVISRAVKAVGTPYRWGGTSPTKGFDCSGLVKYAFDDVVDIDLPRTSNAMAEGHGQKVDRKDLKPGDLLFFNIKSRRVNHVAIYLGNDRFVHAPRRGKSVTIDTLKKPYWDNHYVVAKRVLPKEPPQKKGTVRIAQR